MCTCVYETHTYLGLLPRLVVLEPARLGPAVSYSAVGILAVRICPEMTVSILMAQRAAFIGARDIAAKTRSCIYCHYAMLVHGVG